MELNDDDADALEALLRFLYTGDYDHKSKGWIDHLKVAMTSDKYLLPELEQLAVASLATETSKLGNVDQVFEVISAIRTTNVKDNIAQLRRDLEKKHLKGLIGLSAYREIVEDDKDGMWDLLRDLAGVGPKYTTTYVTWCGAGGWCAQPRAWQYNPASAKRCPVCNKEWAVLKYAAPQETMEVLCSPDGASPAEILQNMGWK